jgi:hypothetical protein
MTFEVFECVPAEGDQQLPILDRELEWRMAAPERIDEHRSASAFAEVQPEWQFLRGKPTVGIYYLQQPLEKGTVTRIFDGRYKLVPGPVADLRYEVFWDLAEVRGWLNIDASSYPQPNPQPLGFSR